MNDLTPSEFDPAINADYHQGYDNQTKIVSAMDAIVGAPVAATADFAASIWNSLPFTPEVQTQDLLRKVSSNALSVYEQHPDAIHAASLVGGLLIPTGLAMNGMKAARAGVKGVNWFSKAGKAEDLAKIDSLIADGAKATGEYRKAKNAFMAKGIANNVLDMAVMEGAIALSMNAHPLMEDYMADPVKHMAMGIAFGGVIGGGLGAIADNFAIKGLAGAANEKAVGTIFDAFKSSREGMYNATKLQISEANIQSLSKITEEAAPYNELTKEWAGRIKLNLQSEQVKMFDSMLGPEIAALPREAKDTLMAQFASDSGMQGVEKVGFLTQKMDGEGSIFKFKWQNKLQDSNIFSTVQKKAPDGTVISEKMTDIAYYPEFGRYASTSDVKYYGRARDTGKSIEQLDAELGPNFGFKPDINISEASLSVNSATVDSGYIAKLSRVDGMTPEAIGKMNIAPDDLSTINAVIARISREPDAFSNIKIRLVKNEPSFDIFNHQIINSEAGNGLKPTHLEDNLKFTNEEAMKEFDLLTKFPTGSPKSELMSRWVGGSKQPLVDALESFRLGKNVGENAKGWDQVALGEAIYNSAASKALRAKFMETADDNGYVYLYRGLRSGKATGHGSLDSYTTDPSKALEFTGRNSAGKRDPSKVKMYKVKVEDIVAGIKDVPEAGHTGRKNEIIVRAATLDSPATLPISSPSAAARVVNTTVDTGVRQVEHMELVQHFADAKDAAVSSLLHQGIPLEAIAVRTNTPLDTLTAFAAAPEGTSLADLSLIHNTNLPIAEYRSAMDIPNYMDPSKRALKLQSNINKQKTSNQTAALDIKKSFEMDSEFKSLVFAGSQSKSAKMIGDRLFGDWRASIDMLRSQIGKFVNDRAGNKFLTSTDHYVNNMGDAGIIATGIGKDLQHITNKIEEAILQPIRNHFESIIKDPLAITEFNTMRELNASLGDYRIYQKRQLWQHEAALDEAGNEIMKLVPVKWQGKEFKIVSDSVDAAWHEMQIQGRELYNMKNTGNQILGKGNAADIGLWVPSVSPIGKHINYVWNQIDGTSKFLWGNTPEELASAVKAYKSSIDPKRLASGEIKIVSPNEAADWNILSGRNNGLSMTAVDTSMQKTGASANAIVRSTPQVFAELAGSYQHVINSNVRNLADLALSDVTEALSKISMVNQTAIAGQPLTKVQKLLGGNKDAAAVIRNTLLGNSNLEQYTNWKAINNSFETILGSAIRTTSAIWDEAVKPFTNGLFSKKGIDEEVLSKIDYKAFSDKLAAKGIVNPWAHFDQEAAKMYGLANLAEHPDSTKRIIYASNAFAATVALRIGELAQPLVNAMSLPILTGLSIANRMPETFMGVQRAASAKTGLVEVMYDGMRMSNDPMFAALGAKWEEAGHFTAMVSESNKTMELARGMDKSKITQVENALNSNIVKWMSWTADKSEQIVRRQTMYTGAALAKRLYPDLDEVGITIYARDFMDRAVGNYHAAQRPVLFQGTAGVALGLFQTYMVTMAQNVYRAIELKNFSAIGKAALAQQTIFGSATLPGFNAVSEAIGTHFSENHYDLTTGTYRAVGDKTANFILYGLPSNLTQSAIYTRGDSNPRFPNLLASGAKDVVGINFLMQTKDMMDHVANALQEQNPQVGRAFAEALSMQSMSRPLARGMELGMGYSVTRKGNTVQTPNEVWSAAGIFSRVLSTRPLEEAKLRQADHLNTFYGAKDRDARNELMGSIKSALRGGTLDDALVANVSEKYLSKGGTPTGWRSAYNTAIAQSNTNGREALIGRLDPDSSLNYMIDNMDGQ